MKYYSEHNMNGISWIFHKEIPNRLEKGDIIHYLCEIYKIVDIDYISEDEIKLTVYNYNKNLKCKLYLKREEFKDIHKAVDYDALIDADIVSEILSSIPYMDVNSINSKGIVDTIDFFEVKILFGGYYFYFCEKDNALNIPKKEKLIASFEEEFKNFNLYITE